MPFDAILFDLDNTLYDYNAYWRGRLARALAPVVAAYPHFDAATCTDEAISQCVYARHFDAFLHQLGIHDASVRAVAVARYRVNPYHTLTLYPQAAPLLRRLRAQGHKLGLITNGPRSSQQPKIRQFALHAFFDVLLISEEVGVAKPDPAIFAIALDYLAVDPARALYVGDSVYHDLHGAHAAGVAAVWVNAQHAPLPPDAPHPWAMVQDIGELAPLLNVTMPAA